MRTVLRPLAAAAVLLAACSFDAAGSNAGTPLGPDDDSDTTGEGEGTEESGGTGGLDGTSSVGADEACIDACAPTAPDGWRGPFHILDGEGASGPECPAGYARQDLGFSGLTASPATCACDCSMGASMCRVDFAASGFPACVAAVEGTVPSDGCQALTTVDIVNVRVSATIEGSPGVCAALPQADVEPAAWDKATAFCAAPARGGSCDEGSCVAAPPEGLPTSLCVARDGEHTCPAPYTQQRIVHRSLQDDRRCDGCSCSGPTACEAELSVHDNGQCSDAGEPLQSGACTSVDVSGSYGIRAVFAEESCTATEASAAGEAVPADPVTVCCTAAT
jgi:hypothetical protein